jgi:hypothetical protein
MLNIVLVEPEIQIIQEILVVYVWALKVACTLYILLDL